MAGEDTLGANYKPIVAWLHPRKPRKKCWGLELDVYDDKSGFDIGTTRIPGCVVKPTIIGSGAHQIRSISKWLNEIADWSEASR